MSQFQDGGSQTGSNDIDVVFVLTATMLKCMVSGFFLQSNVIISFIEQLNYATGSVATLREGQGTTVTLEIWLAPTGHPSSLSI